MQILEVNDNYKHIGIHTRTQTVGKELDMVNDFIEFRKCSFEEKPDNQLIIFIEAKINNAYPDLIFAEYNPSSYERWTDSRNSLDLNDLRILNVIFERKKIKSEDIIKELSIKYKGLLMSLEKLYDSELIDRKVGYWEIHDLNFIGVRKIESVEAKISKWNEVLHQALLNKNFSSESSVLSKIKGDPKDEVCRTFNEFGIGIYLYNDIKFSRRTEPKYYDIPINHNSLLLNEWVGRILNN